MHKTFFNWSSGKDAAMALHLLQNDPEYDVQQLITSINGAHDRVSMHGLRRELLQKQVEAIDLPLRIIELPEQPSMEEYSTIMGQVTEELKLSGFTHSAFGDICLEDLRQYREAQLAKLGLKAVFPLWRRDTHELIEEFIEKGFKAITVSVKANLLDEEFVGREIDASFIDDLPKKVDPCGENGEFHTFCYDGPIFKEPVSFEIGEKVYREYKEPNDPDTEDEEDSIERRMGFWFCDLIP